MTVMSDDLLSKIGNTPLIEIKKITKSVSPVRIFAKLEWFNPGGSVKDRAASRMIEMGEKSGKLTPGKIILDATSGNTGIAYSMIGARKGYKVNLVVPKNICHERKVMITAYGAELIFSDPLTGSDGAIKKCLETYRANPDKYFFPDQYNNDENWKAHFETTGPEIWKQTNGEITHFVAGMGTSGTFMGTSRFLKKTNPKIRVIAAQPDSSFHGLEGWKHMQTSMNPGIYDPKQPDEIIGVSTEDAYEMTLRLAKEEGLFAGVSAGAAMCTALKLAETLRSGTIVTVFPDGGDRYMNDSFWELKDKKK